MRPFQSRLTLCALAGATVLLGMILTRATSAAAASPPKTITARALTRRPNTLHKGTVVKASNIFGVRAFVNATHGFALAGVGEAQYPVATTDGGKTWRTDGPALHVNAAQAPLSVADAGAANQHTFFAFGGGQVVDVTGDGGKHWWQAFLGDGVLSVVSFGNRLIAVAQNSTGSGATAQTVVYVSRDGGRHWHLNNKLGAF
jgi:photosystem II stability/assembly factor-like uncharacterized protein